MLRMGYSSSAIEQELTARHFADNLDGQRKRSCCKQGAGFAADRAQERYLLSSRRKEIARAREKIAAQARHRALEAGGGLGSIAALYQDKLARERAVAQLRSRQRGRNL